MLRWSKFLSVFTFCMLVFITTSCKTKSVENIDANSSIEQQVDSILALMTLDEKIGQMSQIRHFEPNADELVKSQYLGSIIHTQGPLPGNNALAWQKRFIVLQKQALSTRLGIPLLFGVDAVHGQNTFEGATIFPHNIGLGATQNPNLVEEIAKITAIESQATGFNWVFSPCIAIPYNEKWGRVYEGFSESTELTQVLTEASVKGYQSNLSSNTSVMATAKHYVGDGATDYGREGGETSLSKKEISNRLLPPYKTAVNANIGAIMVSFNTIDSIAMHAHKTLITDTLKVKMNFDGMVISDWKGYSRFGGNAIINAGVDMVMAVDGDLQGFQKGLKEGVRNGTVPTERINDAVRRILRQKFRLGLFKNPFPDTTLVSQIGKEKHRNIAKKAVRESLVLLKNNEAVLPLSKNLNKIVVVGEHANNSGLQSGGWTINWQGTDTNYKGATTILEGIKNITQSTVIYDVDASQKHTDADVAIVVIGETPYAEFMGDINGENKYQLTLSEQHKKYINNYVNQGVQVVTILISGRPLVVTDEIEKSNAFIAAWLPGSEGKGIAEVIFGDYNFTGKLPHSWPKSEADFTGKYGPNFWDNSITPLFPFGYGLTYKNFNLNEK